MYKLILDSKLAVGALQTYLQGGRCRDNIYHLYTHVIKGASLTPTVAINIVATPSHWITELNVCVGVATKNSLEVDVTWLHRYPFPFVPMEKF